MASTSINKFIDEWFAHPEWWFSKTKDYDIHITETYEHLLNIDLEETLQTNCSVNIIGVIIIFDQLPRHVFRHHYASHIISYYLRKACYLIDTYKDVYQYNRSDEAFMFFWLPYRHTCKYHLILKVMKEIWTKINQDKLIGNVMKKFLRATYTNIHFHDQISIINHYVNTDVTFLKTCTYNHFKHILDFDGTMTDNNINDKIVSIGNFNIIKSNDTVIVSLSGGVDSMVALQRLQEHRHINIIAVHINYCNRDTSDLEEEFVKWWCAMRNVTLFVRRIEELNRPTCMKYELRDFYETYTRNVRYGVYKSVCRDPIVILGHNKDDCFENIITNMTFQNKYENLHGMTCTQTQDGITFLRPLLSVSKADIITYAKMKGIPYLYDSTPDWSQRGKIRDTIVPVFHTWNKDAIEGFHAMANTMKECHEINEMLVSTYINNCQRITNVNDELPYIQRYNLYIQEPIPTMSMFWKRFFCIFFQKVASLSSTNSQISNKSLKNFLMRMQNITHSPQKIIINKNCIVSYNKLGHSTHNESKVQLTFKVY